MAAFVSSMGTDYQSPGRIMYGGPGTMYVGELDGRPTERVDRLVAAFKDCLVEHAAATSNIWGYLWARRD
jgi:2-dehydropantoate 2-reductase